MAQPTTKQREDARRRYDALSATHAAVQGDLTTALHSYSQYRAAGVSPDALRDLGEMAQGYARTAEHLAAQMRRARHIFSTN